MDAGVPRPLDSAHFLILQMGAPNFNAAIRRWTTVKENLFIIMLEMISKEMKHKRAVKEANQYAANAVGNISNIILKINFSGCSN